MPKSQLEHDGKKTFAEMENDPATTIEMSDLLDVSVSLPQLDFRGYLSYGLKDDERRDAMLAFHDRYAARMAHAAGSTKKHQDWQGGYADHITEMFRMMFVMYDTLGALHPMPFPIGSALIVAYFHDIEKVFKYSREFDDIDQTQHDPLAKIKCDEEKQAFFKKILPDKFSIELTADELNALRYAHGEPHDEYHPTERIMGPLASFLHAGDNISARMWFNQGRSIWRGPSAARTKLVISEKNWIYTPFSLYTRILSTCIQ